MRNLVGFGLAVLVWFFKGGGGIQTCWRWRCSPGRAVLAWSVVGNAMVVREKKTKKEKRKKKKI